jgi:ribonuclease BN (tRNA processing enzyme)
MFAEADLLIFDAQYRFSQALDKRDWGHSAALMGAAFARRAGVKRLALFHHDPTSSDDDLWAAQAQAEASLHCTPTPHPCQVLVATEGVTLDLTHDQECPSHVA